MQTLDAIVAYLREQGPYVLASQDDADYFRKSFRKSAPAQAATPSPRVDATLSPRLDAASLPRVDAASLPRFDAAVPMVTPSPRLDAAVPMVTPSPRLDAAVPMVTPSPRLDAAVTMATPSPRLDAAVPMATPSPRVDGAVTIAATAPRVDATVTATAPKRPKPTAQFAGVRNILSVVAPELAILDEIPNDALAKKLSERWKTKNQTAPISILTFQEPEEQKRLLEEIARALDVYFGPAKLVSAEKIEKEKQWDAFLSVEGLKLVVVCDYTLWQLNHLMQFYKETPAQGIRMLSQVPLFLLPDLSLYLKDASLKRSLWKALCQKCS
ncbi:MAG: hypothetical protein KGQ49_01080 [Verrucomicrobia bacterium]|nr:hypothetical protein [Verrucomicrobiota bacterium]MBU6445975.1 hypothetical protein [Verrucomicrobiota bacterium]MDE3047749.1 hypothetical protein [Verrucomicrobiota bacterium]